jgi:ADP-heptose:LPS heptosyltransferase
MLPLDKIRPRLNKGPYLFFNPLLRLLVGAVDAVLASRPHTPPPLAGVQPRRILVCMQAHIGDAILATSVLPVLRRAFPQAELGMLLHPGAAMVVAANPNVRWVHGVTHFKLDRGRGPLLHRLLAHWRSRQLALQSIRAVGYDLALDLYAYFPNSVPLLAASGIPLRLGWRSGGFGGLLTHALAWPETGPERHVVAWHQDVLALLPACVPYLALAQPQLHATVDERSAWGQTRRDAGVPTDYLVFHLGTGAAFKAWPSDQWCALALRCMAAGHSIVLMGLGEVDEALSRRILEATSTRASSASTVSTQPLCVSLVGALSWRVMSAGIAGARLLVGLDSSAVHVAAAWGVAVVCVAPGVNTVAWRPYSPTARVAVSPTPCSPCHLPNGCEGMECLRSTKAEKVYAEVAALCQRSS